MTTASTRTLPQPQPLVVTLALPAVVVLLAVVGAWLGAGLLRPASDAAPLQRVPKGGYAVGDSVFTSFGAIAIESVEKSNGPTARQLSGVTHGIQGLIPPNKTQLQAFATMTNLGTRPVRYSPDQFSIVVGRKDAHPQRLSGASVRAGVLQPNASIDLRLSFIVPRKGQRLWARFADPAARKAPVLIDLGRVTKTPGGALANYHRHH
jgi:hypothetical protein